MSRYKLIFRQNNVGIEIKFYGRFVGCPTSLPPEIESQIVRCLQIAADWGFPMSADNLRTFVRDYLNDNNIKIPKFKDNKPGDDWYRLFMKRHTELTTRLSSNIKRSRATLSPETITDFFVNLATTLQNVPPENILNYDETNLTDDPGNTLVITTKGTKRVDRVMDTSKQSTSLMFAVTASGKTLPPYVVYKAIGLYDSWCEGGPAGTVYNRTQSGWFEGKTFEHWFEAIALPYLRRLDGKKCVIGDNLSSHISARTLRLCEENNIAFVFLPPNSTHILQPLDVSYFGPMKKAWREILTEWKLSNTTRCVTMPKDCFPTQLNKLMSRLSSTSCDTIKSGFRKTGLYPVDGSQPLAQFPASAPSNLTATPSSTPATPPPVPQSDQNTPLTFTQSIDITLMNFFREHRFPKVDEGVQRRKRRLNVAPGVGVTAEDIPGDKENVEPSKLPGLLQSQQNLY